MDILFLIASGIAGYFLGSINNSIIIGKIYGVDIKKQGSKNAGLTNTARVLGKKAALFVLVGDILKTILACFIGLLIAGEFGAAIAGLLSICGHIWPVYFNFKGGKGVLSTASLVFFLDYRLGFLLLGVFIIVVLISKRVSLGSIISAITFPFLAVVFGNELYFIIITVLLALLVIYTHRGNVERILKGEEPKFSIAKDKK